MTFNDHEGSTRSYAYTREHYYSAIQTDFVPPSSEIKAKYDEGSTLPVTMHDGSTLLLKKTDPEYDPTDRSAAMKYLETHSRRGEVVTGLMFMNQGLPEMHAISETAVQPLTHMDFETLNPGSQALADLQKGLR